MSGQISNKKLLRSIEKEYKELNEWHVHIGIPYGLTTDENFADLKERFEKRSDSHAKTALVNNKRFHELEAMLELLKGLEEL